MAEKNNEKPKDEKISVKAEPAHRREPEEPTYTPLVDIYETADGTTVLEAEVPGASPGSVDLRVEKGVLTIYADGRMSPPGEEFTETYRGFVGGQYHRAFALSDEIDREAIESSLSDGVLTVRLPRAAAAKTRRIEIKQG